MTRKVNFKQSNLLPLIGALKENTESGSFTIGAEKNAPVGGAYFHVITDDEDKNEVKESFSRNIDSASLIDRAVKFKENPYARWAVVCVSEPFLVPKYFEKKSLAVQYKRWARQDGTDFRVVDLDRKVVIKENFKAEVESSEVDLSSFKKKDANRFSI